MRERESVLWADRGTEGRIFSLSDDLIGQRGRRRRKVTECVTTSADSVDLWVCCVVLFCFFNTYIK